MKILHIAPFNTSGVPIALVNAERKLGHYSRLVTLAHDKRNYPEDICLNLPFIDFIGTRWIKRIVSSPDKLKVEHTARIPAKIPKEWYPANVFEKSLVAIREKIWEQKIFRAIKSHTLLDFDIYQQNLVIIIQNNMIPLNYLDT